MSERLRQTTIMYCAKLAVSDKNKVLRQIFFPDLIRTNLGGTTTQRADGKVILREMIKHKNTPTCAMWAFEFGRMATYI